MSAERVSKELLKLLAASDPRPSMAAMRDAGVLAKVLPEADPLAVFEVMTEISTDPVLRLSALLPADPAVIEAAARRLRLPNAMTARLIAAAGDGVRLDMSETEARAALYRAGRAAFADRAARAEAAAGRPDGGRRLRDLAEAWAIPRLPVGGRQVAAAGLEAGPETGRVLKAFEDGWIADDFPDHGHTERLRALVAASGRD